MDEDCEQWEGLPEGEEALVCFWASVVRRRESYQDGGEKVGEGY